MLVIILVASFLFTAITMGGMVLFQIDHGMNAIDSMICIDHCLQAFSAENITPPLLTFLFIVFVSLALLLALRCRQRLEHQFQRWRESIGILLRHQRLATIVLRD